MTDPHHARGRREDLAAAIVRTASFRAEPGKMYPVSLAAATGDIVVTFPNLAGLTTIEGCTFGVIVSATHATHRLAFDLDGQTFGGVPDPSMSAFELGTPDSDRKEFILFALLAGSWQIVGDGRRRLTVADIQEMIDDAIAAIPE